MPQHLTLIFVAIAAFAPAQVAAGNGGQMLDLIHQACTIVGMVDDEAVDGGGQGAVDTAQTKAIELLTNASIRTPETLEALWDHIDWPVKILQRTFLD